MWRKYAKKAKHLINHKIKVALVINEFFGAAGTGIGGYGALARKYISKYIPCDNISIDVLLGGGGHRFSPRKYHIDDVNLYKLPRRHWASRLFLKRKKYDIYLSIELTDDWVLRHETNKNTKLILWIQDPRPKYEWDEIETMTLMPEPNYYNQKIYDLVHNLYKDNRVRFISQANFLNPKAKDLYSLSDNVDITYVPNPIEIDETFDVKNYKKQNKIIFLGRLEDVKRGWLFCEIAKRLPEYEFFVLGKINSTKQETADFWDRYKDIPNLHFAGHVDGEKKTQFLKDAKILINTSIHEALPVSFLEALSYGCCLVSNRNPDSLTEKFGICVGDVIGNGFDKIDLYVDAVRKLMTDEEKRKKLSLAGREYVEKVHNVPKFIHDLREIIYAEVNNSNFVPFHLDNNALDDKTKISVIMPVHNAEKFISQAIQSVLNQTYANLELICIDDASDDKSLDIITKYMEVDKRIILLKNFKNLGVGKTRNIGINNASGDYIMFIDADDYYDVNLIQKVVSLIKNSNYPDIIEYNFALCDENGDNITPAEWLPNIPTSKILKNNYWYLHSAAVWLRAFKRKFILQHNILNSDIKSGEDNNFIIPAYEKAQSIYYLNYTDKPYIYRQVKNSLSKQEKRAMQNFINAQKIFDIVQSDLKRLNIYNPVKFKLLYLCGLSWNISLKPMMDYKSYKYVRKILKSFNLTYNDFKKYNCTYLYKKYSAILKTPFLLMYIKSKV